MAWCHRKAPTGQGRTEGSRANSQAPVDSAHERGTVQMNRDHFLNTYRWGKCRDSPDPYLIPHMPSKIRQKSDRMSEYETQNRNNPRRK